MPRAHPSDRRPPRPAHLPWSFRAALVALGLIGVAAPARAQSPAPPPTRLVPLAQAPAARPGFTRLPTPTLAFTNVLSEIFALNNQILENGAGVALADVNGDGLCDVYLCGSENDNALFLNQGGWSFTNVTATAGVACKGDFSTGAAFADVDGDRDPDLLVNGLGVGTRLFLNDGTGRFTESTQSGLRRNGAATSLALADLDGDGDLDLYVCQYRSSSIRGEDQPPAISARIVDGRAVVTPADRFIGFPRPDGTVEIVEKGEPDRLYWNDGRGRFTPVSWTQGAFTDASGRPLQAQPEDWGLAVCLRDLNGDGHPDIYVCNDFFRSRDQLWLGDGRGRFRAAGADVLTGFPLSSMSVDVADLDRDGHDDVLVAEMLARDQASRRVQRANAPKPGLVLPLLDPAYQIEHARNVVLRARGDGSFADIAWFSGLAATDWTWNVAFIDVDLDGWEDLLVANGNAHDVLDMDAQDRIDREGRNRTAPLLGFYPLLAQPNLAFRNNRDLTFTESGNAWGFQHAGVSQGLALADLDGDGDLDAVLNNLNREAWLYRNDSPAPRIAVRLRGPTPNTAGIGARIVVTAPPASGIPARQSQVVVAGGRYLSSDDAVRTFATGSASHVQVEVEWPDGRRTRVEQIPSNHLCEVAAPAPATTPAPIRPARLQPVTRAETGFIRIPLPGAQPHAENPADPAFEQPLLPARLGSAGPGVAWVDWDADGWEDLVLGAAEGGTLQLLRNDTRGGFEPVRHPALQQPLRHDLGGLAGFPSKDGFRLFAASTFPGDGSKPGATLLAWTPNAPTHTPVTPPTTASAGPVAVADVDGDGDLDVFVGGRFIPGRWPEPAPSQLLLRDGTGFRPDATPLWGRLGLVQGAVFTDLDDDADPDLAVACEWGPVRLFRNTRGQFEEWVPQVGGLIPGRGPGTSPLSEGVGRWTGIAAGDFDADGRTDLVVGNWGRNTREHAAPGYELWHGDFAGSGQVAILETVLDPVTGRRMPWRARDEVLQAFPWVPERFETYRAFAQADVGQLLAGRDLRPTRIPLVVSDSIVLLARGERFEARPLPTEAQFAPAFGVAVADFDGDGRHDVFLAQNFFGTEPETPRLDAGLGLVLAGDGKGGFRAVPAAESGVRIAGEQRGVALADFDHDGRIDVAVGVNNGPAVLLRNRSGRPGWRIRLAGGGANPDAIGARLRLHARTGAGPVQEIRAGSGWLSQDGATAVMHLEAQPSEVEVRWPGGGITRHAFPAGTTSGELVLRQPGQ